MVSLYVRAYKEIKKRDRKNMEQEQEIIKALHYRTVKREFVVALQSLMQNRQQ